MLFKTNALNILISVTSQRL